MNLITNDFSRMFEDDETPAFCCDAEWNIVSINDCIKKDFPQVTIGFNANNFSKSNAAFFLNSFSNLSKGLPSFSTNFEFLSKNATIYVLPDTSEKAVLYCCVLQIQDNPPVSPVLRITDNYRSPIADILNSASVLARKSEENEDYVSLDYLNHIARCCYNMLKTGTTAQTYFRLTNKTIPVEKSKVCVNAFMDELCKTVHLLFFKSSHSFEFHIDKENIISELDSDLFSLALFHLIANGCLFSPIDSKIEISLNVKLEEQAFFVTVTDEGDGISAANQERIFEPFVTIHETPVVEENLGLGLGLPIVKEIVKLHGGNIFIKSGSNRGTSMVLRLPIVISNDASVQMQSNTAKYITNKFSNSYILFADICDIKLF